MRIEEWSSCRLCGKPGLEDVLDLGTQKIANQFHRKISPPLDEAPLVLGRCPHCGLTQLRHSVSPDTMYREYWYRSGINDTMRQHLRGLAHDAAREAVLEPGDLVIDIGGNDGTLLRSMPHSVRRVSVDPSGIVPGGDIIHVHDYFSAEAVKGLGLAKLITSVAMFYDLDEPRKFAQEVRKSLQDDGVWVAELSYTPSVVQNNAFDSICHEHVAYYNFHTFSEAIKGLFNVVNVQFSTINGGSFQVTMSPTKPENTPVIAGIVEYEQDYGYCDKKAYVDLATRVQAIRADLKDFLNGTSGKKVYGYGASTKGQVVMQYCGIGPDNLVAIAERNPDKIGLYTPGSNVRICTEQEMREAKPDFVLVFPWYFWREFREREIELANTGTKFVLPLPSLEIL